MDFNPQNYPLYRLLQDAGPGASLPYTTAANGRHVNAGWFAGQLGAFAQLEDSPARDEAIFIFADRLSDIANLEGIRAVLPGLTNDVLKKTEIQAYEIFEELAARGMPEAKLMTAIRYSSGIGVAPDFNKASACLEEVERLYPSAPLVRDIRQSLDLKMHKGPA